MKMVLDPRNLTLRTKLVSIIGIVIAAGLLPLTALLSRRVEELSRRWFERRALGMTTIMAHAVAPGVEFDDPASVGEFLHGLMYAPEVLWAVVRRADGSVLASFRAPSLPKEMAAAVAAPEGPWVPGPGQAADAPSTLFMPDQLRVDAPIHAKGGATGRLTIGYTLAEMQAESHANRLLVTVVCGLIALFGIVLFFLIGTILVRPILRMTAMARRIAAGDLSPPEGLSGGQDEIGQMAEAFNRMIEAQREMVQQLGTTSAQLAAAAAELYASVQDQEEATATQSRGVENVTRTMQSLLDSAAHIAESARGVLANAERSRETADATSGRISELSKHISRIAELLEVIRDIADRSDLLALNASLEATRAGEAGRAFSLVAGEMRRLAERVTASVQDVKSLFQDVRSSGTSTVLATEEGLKLTESTTESARQITVVTQRQRTETEQVSESMRHIAALLSQSFSATQQTRASAAMLKSEADRLEQLVGRFRLGQPGDNGGGA